MALPTFLTNPMKSSGPFLLRESSGALKITLQFKNVFPQVGTRFECSNLAMITEAQPSYITFKYTALPVLSNFVLFVS